MSEKTYKTLKGCHMALMIILGVMNILIIAMLAYYIGNNSISLAEAERASLWCYVSFYVANTLAFVCGFIYLLNDYGKDASVFYKAFLVLVTIASVFGLVTVYLYTGGNILPMIFLAVKIVILLILAFGKDLGKKKSWILFSIIFIADIVVGVTVLSKGSSAMYRVTGTLTRLLFDGTIGLSIMGKYHDKDQRGTK